MRTHLKTQARGIVRATSACLLMLVAACQSSKDQLKTENGASTSAAPKFKILGVGDAAPLYEIATLTGDSVHVGKVDQPVTVMNVWATWCVSCREEMQDLQGLYNDYHAKGVRVVGVSVDESDVARVRKFVEREKLTFDIVHDQEGRVQSLYQVSGIPHTYIIGKDGKLIWKSIGNLHGVVDSLRRVLDAAP